MENNDMPVYPTSIKEWSCVDREMVGVTYSGLTKREYFAAMAMQGLMAVNDKGAELRNWDEATAEAARISVLMADALLLELSKPKP